MVITRNSGNVGICSCKVGACRKCGSTCKRCKCACDGVAPLDALKRKVGKVAKKRQTQSKLQNNRKKRQCTIILSIKLGFNCPYGPTPFLNDNLLPIKF